MSHETYLTPAFYPNLLIDVSKLIAKKISDDKVKLKINSIAVTGVSGLVVGGVVSTITRLPLIVVRKSPAHSPRRIEYADNIGRELRYCFIDDFISTGATLVRIAKTIYLERDSGATPKLIKAYLYNENGQDYVFTKTLDDMVAVDDFKEMNVPVTRFYFIHLDAYKKGVNSYA